MNKNIYVALDEIRFEKQCDVFFRMINRDPARLSVRIVRDFVFGVVQSFYENIMATPKAERGHQKTSSMNEIKLGDKVRSKVSGFFGTVTGKCEYLHGSTTYAVTAPEPVDGEVKVEWFGETELEIAGIE